MKTYQQLIESFDIRQLEAQFDGDFDKAINVCHEICDRYAEGERLALRHTDVNGETREYSFQKLRELAAQFANYLHQQGIGRGDRVAGLLPRSPELLITILGTLRAGAVYQPLFTAFGPDAIEYRLQRAETRLIVTNNEQWPKLAELKSRPRTLVVGDDTAQGADDHWQSILSQASNFEPVMLTREDPCLQMFTSGTTGKAKGVSVPVHALLEFRVYMADAVGLRPEDRFWNVADPGWAYGLYYGVVGPLSLGTTIHFNEHPFTADNALSFLSRHKITNLAAAPTAYRLLMANDELVDNYPDIQLRVASSAGEPLSAEIVHWMQRRFNCPTADHYGQTETGMTAANFHTADHPRHPNGMGYPLPGFRLAIVDAQANELPAGETGILAVDTEHSPLMFFRGYTWGEKAAFTGRYYLTGDMVTQMDDGSFIYSGRDDDIIASAGYRIGPADVEGSLIEHPAVVESAVVGKPDSKRGHIVKAYVVLSSRFEASDALAEELQQFVRKRLSAHAYPREITFVDELPKTPSGKLQRFILRQQAAEEASG